MRFAYAKEEEQEVEEEGSGKVVWGISCASFVSARFVRFMN